MKRFFLFSLVVLFVLISTSAMAVGTDRPGKMTFKAGWLLFTDEFLIDTESDEAPYVAIEAKSRLTDNLDIGMEIGYVKFEGDNYGWPDIGMDVSGQTSPFYGVIVNKIRYIPIEFNLSHTNDIGPLVYTLGMGFSINHINWDIRVNDEDTLFTLLSEEDQWTNGIQVFFDFSYKVKEYFAGFEGKYQYVEDTDFFDDWVKVNFHNWRTNLLIGRNF